MAKEKGTDYALAFLLIWGLGLVLFYLSGAWLAMDLEPIDWSKLVRWFVWVISFVWTGFWVYKLLMLWS